MDYANWVVGGTWKVGFLHISSPKVSFFLDFGYIWDFMLGLFKFLLEKISNASEVKQKRRIRTSNALVSHRCWWGTSMTANGIFPAGLFPARNFSRRTFSRRNFPCPDFFPPEFSPARTFPDVGQWHREARILQNYFANNCFYCLSLRRTRD